MCPGVDFVPLFQEMCLNVVCFKDDWHPASGTHHLAKQPLRKPEREDMIDINQGHGQLAN